MKNLVSLLFVLPALGLSARADVRINGRMPHRVKQLHDGLSGNDISAKGEALRGLFDIAQSPRTGAGMKPRIKNVSVDDTTWGGATGNPPAVEKPTPPRREPPPRPEPPARPEDRPLPPPLPPTVIPVTPGSGYPA